MLHFSRAHRRLSLRIALEPPEVPVRESPGLGRVEVPHQTRRDIVGRVVDGEIRQGFLARNALQIAGPAHDRPLVRGSHPERGLELLLELPGRSARSGWLPRTNGRSWAGPAIWRALRARKPWRISPSTTRPTMSRRVWWGTSTRPRPGLSRTGTSGGSSAIRRDSRRCAREKWSIWLKRE